MTDKESVQTLETNAAPVDATTDQACEEKERCDSCLVRAGHIAVLAIVACLAVWHGWKKDHILAPTDALKLVAPWKTLGKEYIASNEQLLDQTAQFVPWTYYTVECYKQGQIPLWNPHAGIGQPFLANGQSAVFFPTIFLHMGMSPTWSWVISAALRLFIAGAGVWMLVGRYGLTSWARLLPAVAFMLCGFNIVWLNHPQMNVMPFLPWAILLTEMLVERVRFYRVLGATLVLALAFLGGHPATMVHLLLACGVVFVFRAVQRLGGRGPRAGRLNGRIGRVIGSGAGLGAAVVFAFALAAAQWLPMIEYARSSGAMVIRKEKLASAKFFELDPRYLIGVVFPYANGFPDGVAPFEMRQATKLPNTNELAPAFIGVVPLVLAIVGIGTMLRRRSSSEGADVFVCPPDPFRSTRCLYFSLAILATLIAIRFPLIDHLVRLVPILKVSQNARLLGVTALALAVLAGFGLNDLLGRLRQGAELARLRRALAWCAIGTVAIAAIGAAGLLLFKGTIISKGLSTAQSRYDADPVHEHSIEHVKGLVYRIHQELLLTDARLLIPAVMLGALFGLLWLRKRKAALSTGAIAAALLLLGLIDLLAFAIPFNPGAPRGTWFPDTKVTRTLEDLPQARFAGPFRTFLPETATAYGLSDLRSYDALAPVRYFNFWRHEGIGDLPDYMQGYLSRFLHPERPAWSLLNFGYYLSPVDQPAPPADLFKPVAGGGDEGQIYQVTSLRPRAWVAAKAQVLESEDAVLDRVAKFDFKPEEVVLLDNAVTSDQRGLLDEALKRDSQYFGSSSTSRATVSFADAPKGEDDRPEIVRLRVSGGGGGWLVLADAYTPGWTAWVIDDKGFGREAPVLPAYGALHAVQIPAGTASARVEFRYRPWSWRIGALVSVMSVCIFALLCAMVVCRKAFVRNEGEL